MSEEIPANIAQIIEHAETVMPDMARIVAAYYQALIDLGVPFELTFALVRDWHQVTVCNQGINNENE